MANQENSKVPERCLICATAYNSINGRYCQLLRRYVEYAQTEPCIANAVSI